MSQLAGTKAMAIAGRVALERERCIGMSEAERAWRRQWLADQALAPHEPVHVEEYWRQRVNPIRRFYRAPLDTLFAKLQGPLGVERANLYRYISGKLIMVGFGAMAIHYYVKYGGNDWTKKGGWRAMRTRPKVLPHQKGFPFKSERTCPEHYANRGFKNSPI